jgi:acetyl-CoA acetyltransferase
VIEIKPGQGRQAKSMHSTKQTRAGSKRKHGEEMEMDKACGSGLTAAAAGQRLLRARESSQVVRVGSSSVAVTPKARQFNENRQQPPAFDWHRAASKRASRLEISSISCWLLDAGGTYWVD